jgi:hypothetical protein
LAATNSWAVRVKARILLVSPLARQISTRFLGTPSLIGT